MDPPRFDTEPLHTILAQVRGQLARADRAELIVPHPDLGFGRDPPLLPGEPFELAGRRFRHRSLRLWVDLAERLHCRLALPESVGPHHIRLAFERLGPEASWHRSSAPPEQKYGSAGDFSRLDKLEEPRLLLDLLEAVERAAPPPGGRVLGLGINDGREFDLFALLDPERAATLAFTGIDRSASALARARERHPAEHHRFIVLDLSTPDALTTESLGPQRFDLIMALGLLQSPSVDDRALLRTLIRDHATKDGALILGVPNSRYRGGEPIYGARTRNYASPESSLLFKDVAFYRKYLQQHRYRVFVTGKWEVVVVGKR